MSARGRLQPSRGEAARCLSCFSVVFFSFPPSGSTVAHSRGGPGEQILRFTVFQGFNLQFRIIGRS